MAFDAFDRGGAGALASWMLASGNEDALDPVIDTIQALVDQLSGDEGQSPEEAIATRQTTLTLVLLALGDALMGERMATSLNLPRGAARGHAESLLIAALDRQSKSAA